MSVPGIALPATGTIVDTFKQSFTNVPIDAERDNAVATTEFCDAAESLTSMFGADRRLLRIMWWLSVSCC